MNWITQPVTWLFEGVGGLIVVGVVGWLSKRFLDSKRETIKGEVAATSTHGNASVSDSPVASGSNITQTVNSPTLYLTLPALSPVTPHAVISVEVREVAVNADHFTVFVGTDDQLRCQCNAFVETYIVNTVESPTTIKTAEFSLKLADREYRGTVLSIGNDFEFIRSVRGWRGALATLFAQAKPLDDLGTSFNSKVFERSRGMMGWLRFSVNDVLVNDLERLKSGDGVEVTVTVIDALGKPHEGTRREPWPPSGTVVTRPEWKGRST